MDVFREGSVWSNLPELMWKNSTHCNNVVQEGWRNYDELEVQSVHSNHPELMWKNSTHLVISAMKWSKKVRETSTNLNYPELVHKHAAHFASPLKVYLEKVRWSRTIPNSCLRTLHTLLSLWFEKVWGGSMCLNYPELVHKNPAHLTFPSKMYLEKVRYSRTTQTNVKELYTPCHISNKVVKGGSRRFNALELPRTSAKVRCPLCFPFKGVPRECSVRSNHPELMFKTLLCLQ